MGLNELAPGEKGVVIELYTTGSMRRRFLDIGLVRNTVVECVGAAPEVTPRPTLSAVR